MPMPHRALGPFSVSAVGYGASILSLPEGPQRTPEEAIATVHAALDAGITLIDTADVYAPSWDTVGHNERLIAEALGSWSGDASRVVVATKGGLVRTMDGRWSRNGSYRHLRSAVEASLTNLGRDVIDVYQWHRPDRWQVFADVIESFKILQMEGLIRAVGLSNVISDEIEIAIELLGPNGLASVQNQFSPTYRCSFPELELCRENKVAFLSWSPLGGAATARQLASEVPPFATVAERHGVSPARVAVAWALAQGEHVIPLVGASRPETIRDSAAGAELELTEEDLEMLGGHTDQRIPSRSSAS
ncbi:aldo/keto reductase [Granulicoccus phenolivorans]|uniref:aldo/keto reductase n=1 Tax=Granulicoccus phenolivorans TaxID=266854 RepID=UPI000406EA19|nr:aldo/keto reductase [Granulicoccus phenolivorans]